MNAGSKTHTSIGESWVIHFYYVETQIWVQCDQIGRFLEGLGDTFNYKSSPNVRKTLLGYFEHTNFQVKSAVATF